MLFQYEPMAGEFADDTSYVFLRSFLNGQFSLIRSRQDFLLTAAGPGPDPGTGTGTGLDSIEKELLVLCLKVLKC